MSMTYAVMHTVLIWWLLSLLVAGLAIRSWNQMLACWNARKMVKLIWFQCKLTAFKMNSFSTGEDVTSEVAAAEREKFQMVWMTAVGRIYFECKLRYETIKSGRTNSWYGKNEQWFVGELSMWALLARGRSYAAIRIGCWIHSVIHFPVSQQMDCFWAIRQYEWSMQTKFISFCWFGVL